MSFQRPYPSLGKSNCWGPSHCLPLSHTAAFLGAESKDKESHSYCHFPIHSGKIERVCFKKSWCEHILMLKWMLFLSFMKNNVCDKREKNKIPWKINEVKTIKYIKIYPWLKNQKGQYLKYFAFHTDAAMKCSYDLSLVCFSPGDSKSTWLDFVSLLRKFITNYLIVLQ